MKTQKRVLCIVALHMSLPKMRNTLRSSSCEVPDIFPTFKKKFRFSRQISTEVPNSKFQENPSTASCVATCGQTHGQTIRRFPGLACSDIGSLFYPTVIVFKLAPLFRRACGSGRLTGLRRQEVANNTY
jgi:hypothetical protein